MCRLFAWWMKVKMWLPINWLKHVWVVPPALSSSPPPLSFLWRIKLIETPGFLRSEPDSDVRWESERPKIFRNYGKYCSTTSTSWRLSGAFLTTLRSHQVLSLQKSNLTFFWKKKLTTGSLPTKEIQILAKVNRPQTQVQYDTNFARKPKKWDAHIDLYLEKSSWKNRIRANQPNAVLLLYRPLDGAALVVKRPRVVNGNFRKEVVYSY